MHKHNYIGIATNEMYRIFDILNEKYFEGLLETPMITIQRAKRAGNLGWFTLDKVWLDKEAEVAKYEINVCCERLADEPHDIVETLLHEMVHYSNKVNDIKDCSGNRHNKKFMNLAESVGLVVEKSAKYGFGHTTCSESLLAFIKDTVKPDANCFSFFRDTRVGQVSVPKPKTIFTYKCPECGESVRAKEGKKIVCGECDVAFVMKV